MDRMVEIIMWLIFGGITIFIITACTIPLFLIGKKIKECKTNDEGYSEWILAFIGLIIFYIAIILRG